MNNSVDPHLSRQFELQRDNLRNLLNMDLANYPQVLEQLLGLVRQLAPTEDDFNQLIEGTVVGDYLQSVGGLSDLIDEHGMKDVVSIVS